MVLLGIRSQANLKKGLDLEIKFVDRFAQSLIPYSSSGFERPAVYYIRDRVIYFRFTFTRCFTNEK